jgi:hypothetical protein
VPHPEKMCYLFRIFNLNFAATSQLIFSCNWVLMKLTHLSPVQCGFIKDRTDNLYTMSRHVDMANEYDN